MYTLSTLDGGRNLVLEHGLSELEGAFCRVRDEKFVNRAALTPDDKITIKAFVAAMHVRTRAQREHQRSQWSRVLDMVEAVKRVAEGVPPAARRAMFLAPASPRSERVSLEEIRETVESPMQTLFSPMFQAEFQGMMPLDLAIFHTTAEPGFITSDAPCVWFEPDAYKRPPMLQAPGLGPTIQITLPVSPSLLVLLNRQGLNGYLRADEDFVDAAVNRRTRWSAREHFVVNSNTKRDVWFDTGIEPDDS